MLHYSFDLPQLTVVTMKDGSFYKTKSLTLESIWIIDELIELIFLNWPHSNQAIHHSTVYLIWLYQVGLITINWLNWSSSTHWIHCGRRIIRLYIWCNIRGYDDWLIDWNDLPQLTTLSTEYWTFVYNKNLTLSSMIMIDSFNWSS